MAGFYDAPLVLSSGAMKLSDGEALSSAIRIAKKHALPLELRPADDPAAVRAAKDAARDAGVPVNVVGSDMLFASGFDDIDAMQRAARAMAETKLPFVLGLTTQLGGMSIADVIARIDGDLSARPWHYVLDDMNPAQAEAELETLFRGAPALAHRVVGLYARADGPFESPDAFARGVRECGRNFGLHVLGPSVYDAEMLGAIASTARAEV